MVLRLFLICFCSFPLIANSSELGAEAKAQADSKIEKGDKFLRLLPRKQKPKVPKIEVGFGIADLYLPNYPASDNYKNYIIPFPYAYYRGDWIEADRDKGIRSKIFENANVELSISFGGSLPVDSSDNEDREGMEDLDWGYEFGPNLIYTFPKWGKNELFLQIPLRLVSTTDFGKNTRERGVLFNPRMIVKRKISCSEDCHFEFQLGAQAASKKLHRYFYEVTPKDANASRPLFDPDAGYLGTYFLFKYRVANHKWRYGISASWDDYSQNANKNSPLFKTEGSFAISVFWAMKLWDSNNQWVKF